ncbi:helix-turn-helix domain-containing protein [Desulfonatronospira sp.]|uniref:helix-turn-helix domain-containing protein n=1 Tax=Desulfonatronospira sp. TaxID=1962951 RepID=UPI0025BFBDA4|nr:helix-turn-helix domain-containing protein [Desulfonatronospira sp.]
MKMQELGQKLYEERNRKGLSLEQVQDETKISLNFLKALEEGDVDKLPHPVYARGFMQNYARFLGLDWQNMVEEFSKIYYAEESSESLGGLPTVLKEQKRARFFSYTLRTSVLILALFIIVGLGWLFYSSFLQDPAQEDLTELAEEIPAYDYVQEEPLEGAPLEDRSLAPEGPGTSPESVPQEDVLPRDEVDEPQPRVTQMDLDAFAVEPEETEEEEVPDTVLVLIEAHEESWLRYETDEERQDHLLRPGDSIEVEYTGSMRLRLGNAGGVSISLNGEPYDLNAVSGEVRTVEFNQTP